jgi:RNA polymerase sigma-70 factor, ECF subfamily
MGANRIASVPEVVLDELTADPTSFTLFYRDALPVVYGYLLHRCGSSALAEDLTQETFMAAVAELKKGYGISTPLPWICGIARHKLVDHFRRQGRSVRMLAVEASEIAEFPWEPAEASEGVDRALASLPAAQRAALLLRHVDGYSVPEVASILGRSVEAVESLLSRGRSGFRRALLEGCDD